MPTRLPILIIAVASALQMGCDEKTCLPDDHVCGCEARGGESCWGAVSVTWTMNGRPARDECGAKGAVKLRIHGHLPPGGSVEASCGDGAATLPYGLPGGPRTITVEVMDAADKSLATATKQIRIVADQTVSLDYDLNVGD